MATYIALHPLLGSSWAQDDGWSPWCMLMMLCCDLVRPSNFKPFWTACTASSVSPSRTELVVFNGTAFGTWHVHLPTWASMCFPSLPPSSTRASSSVSLAALAQWQGCSSLGSTFACEMLYTHVQQIFPMMRHLFNAVVRPTVSYGRGIWAPACSLVLGPELKDMLGVRWPCFVSSAKSERASHSTS